MPKKLDPGTLYRRVLSDAWTIAWGHKHLWIFGFFATFIGFGGVTEVIFSAYDRSADLLPTAAASRVSLFGLLPGAATFRALVAYSSYPSATLLVLLVILSLTLAVFLWITVVAVGALIAGVRKSAKGGDLPFGDALKVGAEKFWPLLGVNLLSKIVIVLSFLLTGANLVTLVRDRTFSSGLFYISSFIVFALVAFVASLVAVYGSISVVVKDEKTEGAVTSSLKLVGEHWLISLEMSLLLLVISIALGIAGMFAVVLLSVPIIFILIVVALLKIHAISVALIALTAVMILCVVAALGSFLTTFQTAAWTLLWHEIGERRPLPKLVRLAQGARDRLLR